MTVASNKIRKSTEINARLNKAMKAVKVWEDKTQASALRRKAWNFLAETTRDLKRIVRSTIYNEADTQRAFETLMAIEAME